MSFRKALKGEGRHLTRGFLGLWLHVKVVIYGSPALFWSALAWYRVLNSNRSCVFITQIVLLVLGASGAL